MRRGSRSTSTRRRPLSPGLVSPASTGGKFGGGDTRFRQVSRSGRVAVNSSRALQVWVHLHGKFHHMEFARACQGPVKVWADRPQARSLVWPDRRSSDTKVRSRDPSSTGCARWLTSTSAWRFRSRTRRLLHEHLLLRGGGIVSFVARSIATRLWSTDRSTSIVRSRAHSRDRASVQRHLRRKRPRLRQHHRHHRGRKHLTGFRSALTNVLTDTRARPHPQGVGSEPHR